MALELDITDNYCQDKRLYYSEDDQDTIFIKMSRTTQ